MGDILIIKTGALGDVLRTTSVLPGLRAKFPGAQVVWMTAEGAVDLLRHHPLVDQLVPVKLTREGDDERVDFVEGGMRGGPFVKVLSLDDELPLCGLARLFGQPDEAPGVLSGAYLSADGERVYTDDVAPWFDMGLLSRFGKDEADRRKVANTESHPAIYARMLGIDAAQPELHLPEEALGFARAFFAEHDLVGGGPVIGLNTGAGGRWESKKLPRTAWWRWSARCTAIWRGACGSSCSADRRSAPATIESQRRCTSSCPTRAWSMPGATTACSTSPAGRRARFARHQRQLGAARRDRAQASGRGLLRADLGGRDRALRARGEGHEHVARLLFVSAGRGHVELDRRAHVRRGRATARRVGGSVVNGKSLFAVGKFLEALGLIVVLLGLFASMSAGRNEDGLASMKFEFQGLSIGGLLFLVGWLLERRGR